MINSRKYILEKVETRQSGMTLVTLTTVVTPTLIQAFSGDSFSYSAITTQQLANLTHLQYDQRVNDYLTRLVGIDMVAINNLKALAGFDNPFCLAPVNLSNVVLSCAIEPPITGSSLFAIQLVFNPFESYNIYTVNDGVVEEDNKRVYDITLSPLATGETFTIGFNYELAVSMFGTGSTYISQLNVIKNSVQILTYSANSGITEVEGDASFTINNNDTIRIVLQATGERFDNPNSNGGGISSIEIISSISSGSGVITNHMPLSLQSAKVGIFN